MTVLLPPLIMKKPLPIMIWQKSMIFDITSDGGSAINLEFDTVGFNDATANRSSTGQIGSVNSTGSAAYPFAEVSQQLVKNK